ncbi:MAG: hypothetical protein KDA25_06895 [Phycisphaerales bacterium]|nr:hypothetical protein [Phycisphaerales bacterium]
MLNKTDLITGIQKFNRSARTDWLERFDASALGQYLDHLRLTIQPRGSRWVRLGDTAAIVTRRPVD